MSLAQLAQIRLNAADPTRTVSLRREWMADVTRRHRELGRAIAETVGNMGLGPVTLVAGGTERFLFKRDPEKVDEFMSWLREEEARTTLELIPGRTGQLEPWTDTYVRSSYVKGLEKANRQLRAKGIDLPSTTIRGPQGILGVFHQPFHTERASLIYQRTFEGLKGIDATMNARLRQVLTQGILEGVGSEEIARRMVGKGSPLETIGITRGKLIARTETVETYNQAAVGEYSRAEGIIGEPILVQWITAEDERVRGSHANRHGKIYTQEEFLQLIGEPNCRCAGAPYIESIDGPVGGKAPPAPPTAVPSGVDPLPGRRISSRTGNKKADEISKDWLNGLSEAEKEAVEAYTLNGYSDVNRALRKGTQLRGQNRTIVQGIDSAFESAVNYSGTTYRGLAFDDMKDAEKYFQGLQKGKIITEKGFMSTSVEKKTATEFLAEIDDPVLKVVFEIEGKNGKWLNGASGWEKEKEVLFSRNTSFKVVDGVADKTDSTLIHVKLQEM